MPKNGAVRDNLKRAFAAGYKRILKVSAAIAAVFVAIGLVPALFYILLNIDNPLSAGALRNWIVGALATFIFVLIALLLLISLILAILVLWRTYHQATAKAPSAAASESPPVEPPHGHVTIPLSRRIITAIGGISGFVYFLYYVGRAYSDGYSAYLGIPANLLHYTVQDSVYVGAQIDTIWITLLFTAILVGFFLTWFRQYHIPRNTRGLPLDARVFPYWILGYWVLYGCVLLVSLFWQAFRPDLLLQKAVILTMLTACMFLFGSLTLVFYFDPDVFTRLRTGKTTSTIFAAVVVVTLLIAPYTSGKAWGAFKADVASTLGFPTVQVYANGALGEGITWTPVDALTYRSDPDLYLILDTPDYLVVKTIDANGSVYVLSRSAVRSFTVTTMGRLK